MTIEWKYAFFAYVIVGGAFIIHWVRYGMREGKKANKLNMENFDLRVKVSRLQAEKTQLEYELRTAVQKLKTVAH